MGDSYADEYQFYDPNRSAARNFIEQLADDRSFAPQSSVQRYFLGYSGWAPVQLDMEIAQGGWYVLPADRETILNMDPTVMWRELLARATAVKT